MGRDEDEDLDEDFKWISMRIQRGFNVDFDEDLDDDNPLQSFFEIHLKSSSKSTSNPRLNPY